jgi:hypothetical protein
MLVVAAPGRAKESGIAALERGSEHPLAAAILAGAEERRVVVPDASEFRSLPGKGVTASVGGRAAALGNTALLEELRVEAVAALTREAEAMRRDGQTVVYLVVAGRVAGLLGVAPDQGGRGRVRTLRGGVRSRRRAIIRRPRRPWRAGSASTKCSGSSNKARGDPTAAVEGIVAMADG